MMKKETLIHFIDKYSLGEILRAVVWKYVAADKVLKTRGELPNRTFVMDVVMNGFTEFSEDVRIPIVETPKVRAMLSPLQENITLTLEKNGDRVVGFIASDADCECRCTAGEFNAIPPAAKDLIDSHTYDVEVSLTEEFTNTFLKAKVALSEIDEVTVRMNKKDQLEFVLGYSVANTNRISILAPTVAGKDKLQGQPIKYSTDCLVEILKANKEIPDGKLHLRSGGVAKFIYKNDLFQCTYWQLPKIKK
jgi:hypothetical protein